MNNWEFISAFGKNKLVTSSAVWVVLVPIVAKIIFFIQTKYTINIDLPFSWELFYYSSISFMIGTLLYKRFCPKVILENVSFSDFNSKGIGIPRLLEYSIKKPNIEAKLEIIIKDNKGIDQKMIFSDLWQQSLYDNILARHIITFFYMVGLCLFGYVFAENIFTVINYSIHSHFSNFSF